MAYKSKYYDPQKAHEYYMKHHQLKGRKKKTSITIHTPIILKMRY